MTINVAFFLSGMGDLIHVPDSHIGLVIRDPERFGLTLAEIEAAYRKYGEKVGVEGDARRELLIQVIRLGWVRIRRYRNYWSVNAESLTASTKELLRGWATQMLTGVNGFKEPDRYMPVKISSSEGTTLRTIGDLADGSNQEPLPPSCMRTNENENSIR